MKNSASRRVNLQKVAIDILVRNHGIEYVVSRHNLTFKPGADEGWVYGCMSAIFDRYPTDIVMQIMVLEYSLCDIFVRHIGGVEIPVVKCN